MFKGALKGGGDHVRWVLRVKENINTAPYSIL